MHAFWILTLVPMIGPINKSYFSIKTIFNITKINLNHIYLTKLVTLIFKMIFGILKWLSNQHASMEGVSYDEINKKDIVWHIYELLYLGNKTIYFVYEMHTLFIVLYKNTFTLYIFHRWEFLYAHNISHNIFPMRVCLHWYDRAVMVK